MLIVDDEPANLLLMRRVFTPEFEITAAQDGQEAVNALGREPFDIVLLDIMMPVLNGLQVLKIIRSSPELASLPVILVSALDEGPDIANGLALGANDYITKPVDVNVVMARVQTQLMLQRMLEERSETIHDLRRVQEIRERFFRIATHDMKSPLTNIRLAYFLLRKQLGDNPAFANPLQSIGSSVDKMQQIIHDFLDNALLHSGKLDLHIEPITVEKLVFDVAEQYELAAAHKQITLQVGKTPGTIHADYARMSQVLSNLVSNALKYSPEQTTVRLWSEEHRTMVALFVADEGPGIAPHERDKLFKEFGRTSAQPTGGESSTGLGLWIVKHLVNLHGGVVGVDCPTEGGSIFWASLPARAAV
jgi:two-component system sensor histidine kinase/response regulator